MSAEETTNDVTAFLTVFAALLLDNVLNLDEAVGQVTDLVMSSGKPDRALVVALQSFDRLKQEFEALGDALTRYAEATTAGPLGDKEHAQVKQSVISAITVADLKDRMLRRLERDLPEAAAPQLSESELAEVDVDVVF